MAGVGISKEAKTENVLPVLDDVITEILAKLPVKSLLRFNCVCKTWYSVISNPRFCNNLHQMRPCVLTCENSKKFSTTTIESLLTSKNRAPTPLSLPWETEADDQNQFLGSCNGLVCVDLKSESSPDRSGLILWNPSTRNFRGLPRPSCYQVRDNFFTYAWFGYDESVDDYKLIWVNCSQPCAPPIEPGLVVFTLKSNTWRRPPIDHIKLHSMNLFKANDRSNPKSIGVLSNGAIHWHILYSLPSGGSVYLPFLPGILALDLATEEFRVLKLPDVPFGYYTWVGSLLGCLCSSFDKAVAEEEEEEDGCGGMTLWMMKEYGVESSWTKLISIPYTVNRSGFGFFRFYPILFSKEEGKEIVAMFHYVCEQIGDNDRDEIVKLRIEEGGENVRFEETQLCVPGVRNCSPKICPNNVVLHMEESLVSLPAAD